MGVARGTEKGTRAAGTTLRAAFHARVEGSFRPRADLRDTARMVE
ncbi:hypothetical protein OHT93_02435 [Streptomyces sp. NBC_00191]